MGETTIKSFDENAPISSDASDATVSITVGLIGKTNFCQLLYDGLPARDSTVNVHKVGAEMGFTLDTPGYEFTKATTSVRLLEVISPIQPRHVHVISFLPKGHPPGTVTFTVIPTAEPLPTPPATGPEVTNDGTGIGPIPGG